MKILLSIILSFFATSTTNPYFEEHFVRIKQGIAAIISYYKKQEQPSPNKEQLKFIETLEKEYEECVQEFKVIGNISNEQWALFISKRSIQRATFQQQLKYPNPNYFHEQNLPEEFKNVFNKVCLVYGFSPEAFDIKYDTANISSIARIVFENNRPTLLLNKNANVKDIIESIPHELAHCYMNHPVDAMVITMSFYKYFSQKKFKEQKNKCRFFQEHTADILPAIFGFTSELIERQNPSLMNFIYDVSNPNYLYGQAARDAYNIIDHRIHRQESEKSLEDILQYYPRCNEHLIAALELKRQQQGIVYTVCRYITMLVEKIIIF